MEVILLEKVKNLGNLGDKVAVKPGYARNFLIPQSKAVFANASNVVRFEERRADLEKKEQQSLNEAEQRAAKFNDITLEIAALASDEGRLYGSVGAGEIQEALAAKSLEVNKKEIVLPEGAIHAVGEYCVEIHVHSDVVARLQVQVVPSR